MLCLFGFLYFLVLVISHRVMMLRCYLLRSICSWSQFATLRRRQFRIVDVFRNISSVMKQFECSYVPGIIIHGALSSASRGKSSEVKAG